MGVAAGALQAVALSLGILSDKAMVEFMARQGSACLHERCAWWVKTYSAIGGQCGMIELKATSVE